MKRILSINFRLESLIVPAWDDFDVVHVEHVDLPDREDLRQVVLALEH